MYVELNIDAIVGPSHHYGGVGVGNVASQTHTHLPSHPRMGALEGLRKAKLVADLGVPQYVLPPLPRPLPQLLSNLGFTGDFQSQCAQARQTAPSAYSAVFSSAFMWAANAATVAPACDCLDHRGHLTLANLSSSWHRLFEHPERQRQFQQMLTGSSASRMTIHDALPPLLPLRDEGAANHMRLCNANGELGFHVFVYGDADNGPRPVRHTARQTLAACQAIARLHRLDPSRTFFLQQHPEAIDAGVFHNDVIATSHRNLLLMHELAFYQADAQLSQLADAFLRVTGEPLQLIRVGQEQLSLADAVRSYLFNSQLLSCGDDPGAMTILCASQCEQMASVRGLIEGWISSTTCPIVDAHYVTLDQSMSGGGGPACLRLRMSLPESEVDRFAPAFRLTPALYAGLEQLIGEHYPERLDWESLSNPENLARYARVTREFEILFA